MNHLLLTNTSATFAFAWAMSTALNGETGRSDFISPTVPLNNTKKSKLQWKKKKQVKKDF